MLFLLAINKQFDLRSQMAAGIRALAKAGHWYDERRPMQFVVAIVLPSVLAIFTGAFMATRARMDSIRSSESPASCWYLRVIMAAREGMEAPYFLSFPSMTSARILVVWEVGR